LSTKIFIKNTLYYTFARLLPAGMGFLLFPIYSNYINKDEYGVFSLVTVFSSLAAIIITLQANGGLRRFLVKYLRESKTAAREYFSSIIYLVSGILVTGCLLIDINGQLLIDFFYPESSLSYHPLFRIGVWTILFTTLNASYQALVQVLEEGKWIFAAAIAQVAVHSFFTLWGVIGLNWGVKALLIGQGAGYISSFLILAFKYRHWHCPAFSREKIKESLFFSFPIIPHQAALYVFFVSDRYILEKFVSMDEIGIYSVGDKFAGLLLILVNSVSEAFSPKFLKKAEENVGQSIDLMEKAIILWWIIFIGFILGIAFFTDDFFLYFVNKDYLPAVPFVILLSFAYVFRGLYCFGMDAIAFSKKTKYYMMITLVAAMINIGINILYIPKYGIWAAGISTLAAFFSTFILSWQIGKRLMPLRFPLKSFLLWGFVGLFLFFIHYFLSEYLYNNIQSLCYEFLIMTIYILIVVYIKKNTIIIFIKELFTKKNK